MIYLCIALIVVAFVLFVPVRAFVSYSYKTDYTLNVKVLGLTADIKKLINQKSKTSKHKIKKDELPKSNLSEDEKLLDKISKIYSKVVYFKNVYNASSKTINKHFVTENIEADVAFGTSDAAFTGMLTGAVWALLYEMLGVVSILSTVKTHKFNVDSVYDRCVFDVSAKATFKITVYGALRIAISVIYNLKTKAKFQK